MRPFRLALDVLRNRRGQVPRPAWCTYLVTYRCNARCQMCDSWQIRNHNDLTAEQVAQVFAKIGGLDVVRISGGEPFLRKDLPEIADAIRRLSKPVVLHITTNGSLPDRVVSFVEGFAQPKLLRFMVSFDGLEAEHDRNRGKAVSFDKAIDTVQRLAKLRSRFGLEVSANHTVISPQSLADNAGLRARLAQHGVEVHSVLAYADSSMYGLELAGRKADHLIVPRGYPLHPDLAGADVHGFVARELAAVPSYRDRLMRWGKAYYLEGLQARLKNAEHATPNPKCVALRSHLRLLPDGGVPVCQFNTEVVGNLLTDSFESVWHAPATQSAREWVDGCPGCWAECEVMPNAIYSADLLRWRLGRRRAEPRVEPNAAPSPATGSAGH